MLLGTLTQATYGLRTSTKNISSLGNDARGVNEVQEDADRATKTGHRDLLHLPGFRDLSQLAAAVCVSHMNWTQALVVWASIM